MITKTKKSRSMLNIQLKTSDDLAVKHMLERLALQQQQAAEQAGSDEEVNVSTIALGMIRDGLARLAANPDAPKKK